MLQILEDGFKVMFLPIGYPTSVSDDYFEYQLWDTLQGFAGYLKGIILTLSFLQGLGVGESSADVVSAMFLWIMRDISGVIAGLLAGMPRFTKEFSEPRNLKRWRLTGEAIRIIAGFVQIVSTSCPNWLFMILSCAVVASETCASVMQGQTRSSLITHFAKSNNISDCNAKEGNQDRGVKIFGIPLAFLLIRKLGSHPFFPFVAYLVLVITQFYCTWKAVSALRLKGLKES